MNAEIEAHKNDRVKVGILSGGSRNAPPQSQIERHWYAYRRGWVKNPPQDEQPTDVEVGMANEFGVASLNIPPRSFLRMPLISELPNKMRQIGKNVWADLIAQKGMRHSLEQLGLIAVQTVEMAFATGGFGRWPANQPVTVFIKQSASPLINTSQLRKRISMKIVEAAP